VVLLAALLRFDVSRFAFAVAVAVLAVGPIIWLVNTWLDPAFDSYGFWSFCAFAALAAWSITSKPTRHTTARSERLAIALLSATALVRLAGQVLAIDTIGALALALDVFALAQLAGLNRRARAVSPFWLAAAFAFALPLERIVQRSIGYPLQDISARGACGALSAIFGDVQCAGVRITVQGADVLVDLPCSGARAMILFGFAFVVIAALVRPRWKHAVIGAIVAFAAAVIGNILRITLLAAGVALGPDRLGFDVMAQPWHDLVGLTALTAVAPALIVWARRVKPTPTTPAPAIRSGLSKPRRRLWSAGVFLVIAIAVVIAPRRPADIAARDVSVEAPARIGADQATRLPLTERERVYFQQYGGAAVKAAYGEHALMLARTTSPLRHLHAPDECLRGLGFRVSYLGMRFVPAPTAQYRAIAPDGGAYRVDVSFFSDHGHRAASVSEAVWIWLANRRTTWTAVQRISPETASAEDRAAFEAGVFAALDLPTQSP
jgi:exosortase/archaeosortase family protein